MTMDKNIILPKRGDKNYHFTDLRALKNLLQSTSSTSSTSIFDKELTGNIILKEKGLQIFCDSDKNNFSIRQVNKTQIENKYTIYLGEVFEKYAFESCMSKHVNELNFHSDSQIDVYFTSHDFIGSILIINLEEKVNLDVNIYFLGRKINGVLLVNAKANASINCHYTDYNENKIQKNDARLNNVCQEHICVLSNVFKLEEKANLSVSGILSSNKFTRINDKVIHRGNKAQAKVNVLSLGRNNSLETNIEFIHESHECKSNYNMRALADNMSKIICNGKIIIGKNKLGNDAHMQSKGIIYSDSGQMFFKPELDIANDDVVCTHGAAIGGLSPSAIFFLCQRGLQEWQAKEMLLIAFITELISTFPDNKQQFVTEQFMNWLVVNDKD